MPTTDIRAALDAHDAEDAATNTAHDQALEAAHAETRAATDRADTAEAEVERLRGLQPKTTRYGACPIGGGSGAAAISAVTDKWGPTAAVRLFCNTGNLKVPPLAQELGPVHDSYKPDIASFMAGDPATLETARAAVRALRDGDYLEPWHEFDVKEKKGAPPVPRAEFIRFRNAFYDLVQSVNPRVKVPLTVSVARFTGTEDMTWLTAIKADTLGVDFDGSRATTRYPAWSGVAAKIAAFAKTAGWGWSVPEFIHERIPADTDGTQRTAWAAKLAAEFTENGAEVVHLFEFDGGNGRPTNPFTTPAEVATWKALVSR